MLLLQLVPETGVDPAAFATAASAPLFSALGTLVGLGLSIWLIYVIYQKSQAAIAAEDLASHQSRLDDYASEMNAAASSNEDRDPFWAWNEAADEEKERARQRVAEYERIHGDKYEDG